MKSNQFLEIKNISSDFFREIASKIEFNHSQINECWIWKGATKKGYGYLRINNEQQSLHRIMYAWFIEKIPKGWNPEQQIDHLCNNRLCCNPKHLQLTTQKVNILRGSGPTAINKLKTHCLNGHLLPKENNRSDGGRRCLICRRQMDKIYNQKRNKFHGKSG